MGCLKLTYYENESPLKVVRENFLSEEKADVGAYRFGMNGQERVDEVSGSGNHYTAMFWEYDSRLGRRWNQDPKPNPSISNYAAFANNPIWFSDPLGDTVKITHRTGFLGLGKKQTLNYEGGSLFNADGSAYSGKVKGFLKQTTEALADINKTAEGSSMLSELEGSANVFTIVKGSTNEFKHDNRLKAYANQLSTDPDAAAEYAHHQSIGTDLTGGSGGTIYFNPNKAQMWEQGGKYVNRGNVALGHELFHGLDANRGLLDSRTHLGITRNEWQAVYRENMMRQQMGLPLRTDYKTRYDPNTGQYSPGGPNMLTPGGSPILPTWYKP
jgi:hypothetical protein